MWLIKTSARRQAIREDVVEAESQLRPPERKLGQVLLISAVFFVVATVIMFLRGESIPYHVGQRAPFDLHSWIDDPVQTDFKRSQARANTPAVLVANPQAFDRIQSQLTDLQQDIKDVHTVGALPPELKARWPGLSTDALNWLHDTDGTSFQLKVRLLVTQMLIDVPTVDQSTMAAADAKQAERVYLADHNTLEGAVRAIPRTQLIPLGTTADGPHAMLRDAVSQAFPQVMVDPIVNYLLQLNMPTYRYDVKLTNDLADQAVARVQPQGHEAIVHAGQIIDEPAHRLLITAQRDYDQNLRQKDPWMWWLAVLGQTLTVLLITLAGTLYITRINVSVHTASRAWAMVALLLLTLAIAKISVALWPDALYMLGIAPTLLAAAVLIIAFQPRFALGIAALHGLLVTLALNENFDFFITLLTGVTLLVLTLKEIRTLGKLIQVGVLAGIALLACVWAIGTARFLSLGWNFSLTPTQDVMHDVAINSFWAIAVDSFWAGLAGIAVGFITLGLLPVIERIFKITTAMTLLSLCDLNRPLLRRLAAEAPGTFNHSLIVGTMAEAAGNAIGANGLLCRVGAYYHDVGKLSKPQYFAENQANGPSRHDKLSPAMSLLIIVGHVKDGIELAREYGLPWVVRQFIAQHHGTTLVEYFFNVARERQQKESSMKNESPPVSETEFRYAGPRPQSRETAILMICDGVESIARAMPDHTPGRLENVVHQLVTKRLMDGQFSDCDLTLKDLATIEQSLVRTLAGVYHGRVAYPKPPQAPQIAQTA